jgi:hypothetical protein
VDAGSDAGCVGADACYACTPFSYSQFLNACAPASDVCTPFNNGRVTLMYPDGGLPPVPPPDAGPPDGGSQDAGPLDAGAPDAGPADAGQPDSGGLPLCGANGNPVVYVTGSSASQNFLASLALALYDDPQPLTLVYQNSGSCVGVNDVLNNVATSGAAIYWDPAVDGGQAPCQIPGPVVPDLGVSDVFPETCTSLPNGLPANVGEFFGPVQTMTFVVPQASSQQSISAQAAYSVMGFGSASGVAPWTDGTAIFRRNPTSGTQSMIATAIGVPVGSFQGSDAASSGGVITKVGASPDPEATLGILSETSITPAVLKTLRPLAYQHYDQDCAYLPDSSSSSRDKLNVRTGHYAIWGPLHFLAVINGSGFATNANASRVLGFVTGTSAPPGNLNLIDVEAQSNLVPTCAMQVSRGQEMGPFTSYAATAPCDCAFDQAATGSTACTACTSAAQCPSSAPTCSYGYCEP